jgi:hypothetical protein
LLVIIYLLPKTKRQVEITIILLASFVIVFSCITVERIKVWSNTVALFTDYKYQFPKDHFGYTNLGEEYKRLGQMKDAQTNLLLGLHYYKQGRFSNKRHREWIEGIYTLLGQSYAMDNKIKEAKVFFIKAYNTGENELGCANNLCGIYMFENNIDSLNYFHNILITKHNKSVPAVNEYLKNNKK